VGKKSLHGSHIEDESKPWKVCENATVTNCWDIHDTRMYSDIVSKGYEPRLSARAGAELSIRRIRVRLGGKGFLFRICVQLFMAQYETVILCRCKEPSFDSPQGLGREKLKENQSDRAQHPGSGPKILVAPDSRVRRFTLNQFTVAFHIV